MATAGLPRSVGKEFFDGLPEGNPLIQDLLRAAAVVFGCSYSELAGKSRVRLHFEARSAAIVLATRKRLLSFNFVGHRIGRDHTTVIHASNTATSRILDDMEYEAAVRQVWDLACKGKLDILKAEQDRLERLRHERLVEVSAKTKSGSLNPKRYERRANLPDVPSWTKNQLAEMNEQFQVHMMAFEKGEGY